MTVLPPSAGSRRGSSVRTTPATPVLADVAKRAGVSIPTVSRVISGSRRVGKELSDKVRAAADELGYRPNGAARSLVSGERSIVSVMAGGTANYGYARTIEGIEEAARLDGFNVLITVVDSAETEAVAGAVDLALAQATAGVIVLEFDAPGRAAIKALPSHVPTVVAGGGSRRRGPLPHALIDERAAGRELTAHLLGLGHRTVHHVAAPAMGKHSGRTEGWRAALREADAPQPGIMHATWKPSSGYAWGAKIADMPDVTAVFCGNDDLAIGVIKGLFDRGVRVPRDVSVVGFDDQPFSEMWMPPLTTARQDFNDLGSRAYRLLSETLRDEGEVGTSIATPELIERDSAGPPRKR